MRTTRQRLRPEPLEDRLTPALALDPTFGTGGVQSVGTGPASAVYAVTTAPSGTIYTAVTTPSEFDIVATNPDGTPDTAFATGGAVNVETLFPQPPFDATVANIYAQPDGKLLVLENYVGPGGFVLVRLNADGSVDTTFGTGGEVVSAQVAPTNITGESLTIQPDGKLLVVGYPSFANDQTGFSVVRMNPDGSPDTTFNQTGYQFIPARVRPARLRRPRKERGRWPSGRTGRSWWLATFGPRDRRPRFRTGRTWLSPSSTRTGRSTPRSGPTG
ncbi:hypothetical protein FRUB_04705 [Fimbriiglobus ruber]|uniref:Uncharacterized protein n=1 Tax=Fimbriiglobus ruber TaxID=1908690 RepID=A0A225DIK1_9BACT|nr:hypothetical protein FRUB_04705 [Fimbriiglobus ruber]